MIETDCAALCCDTTQNLCCRYGAGHLKPRFDGLGPVDLAFGVLSLLRDFLPRATWLALRVRGFGATEGFSLVLFLRGVTGLSETSSATSSGVLAG